MIGDGGEPARSDGSKSAYLRGRSIAASLVLCVCHDARGLNVNL